MLIEVSLSVVLIPGFRGIVDVFYDVIVEYDNFEASRGEQLAQALSQPRVAIDEFFLDGPLD